MGQSTDESAKPGDHAAGDAGSSFRFTAQPLDHTSSTSLSGAIDAADPDAAQATLSALRLRVLSLEPTNETGKPHGVRGGDFQAFNQQLAYMTEAGLPMEQGLRLIAQDLKGGRLSATIQQVADELKAGKGLAEAFASHQGAFPPFYGAVLEAGVRSGNLPGVLMSLGRHLELMQRLRAAVWRAVAYPLIVLIGIVLMLGGLGVFLVPQFRSIFDDFDTYLPLLTRVVLDISVYMPVIMLGVIVVGVLLFVLMGFLRATGREQAVFDKLLWVPLIGPAIRQNLICRWCDGLRLGLQAGLDLPGSLRMAAQAVGSRPLIVDTHAMIQTLEQGKPIRHNASLRFVPAAVPAAIELAAHADDLPGMLENLSGMYQQQAEARVAALHTVLGPIMLVLVAVIIGTVVSALFLPLIQLMESLM